MKHPAVINERWLDFLCAEHAVRPRVAVKGEGAVAVFIQLDECQGGGSGPIHGQTGAVNAVPGQDTAQKVPKCILANLADEGGLSAQARRRDFPRTAERPARFSRLA